MTRRLPEELQGRELVPLCAVANLSQARKVESILDEANIEYTFDTIQIASGFLSFGIRDGIAFLVSAGQLQQCQVLLRDGGLSKFLMSDEK